MQFVPLMVNPIDKKQASLMNTLVLAYVGDAVQSLYVRGKLAITDGRKSGGLHARSISEVSARAQSEIVDALLPLFNEEEAAIYQRAKNSKPHSVAKNADLVSYHKATGLEAVLGYLYLTGQTERLDYLLNTPKEN